jgi:hypothetical protein
MRQPVLHAGQPPGVVEGPRHHIAARVGQRRLVPVEVLAVLNRRARSVDHLSHPTERVHRVRRRASPIDHGGPLTIRVVRIRHLVGDIQALSKCLNQIARENSHPSARDRGSRKQVYETSTYP